MIRTRLSRLAGAFAILSGISSCSGGAPGDSPVASTKEALYVPVGVQLWNNNQYGTGVQIPVCFLSYPLVRADTGNDECPNMGPNTDCEGRTTDSHNNTFSATKAWLRQYVRTNIENTWMRYSSIEPYNWGDCPTVNINGQTKHRDSDLVGYITMYFSQPPVDSVDMTWPEGKSSTSSTHIRYNWDAFNAHTDVGNLVHEFGHALGFQHEWNRPDWPTYVCIDSGEIKSDVDSNKCVDVNQGNWTVEIWDCNGGSNQQWKLNRSGSAQTDVGTLQSLGKCMAVQAGGSGVLLATCDGSASQQWQQVANKPGALVNPSTGQCLDLPNSNTTNGTQLQIYSCNGQSNQHWGDIVPAATTLGTPADTDSIMEYCVSRSSPEGTLSAWDIAGVQYAYGRKPTGSLVGYRGECANVQGGSTSTPTPIITYPCRGTWNDKWLRSDSNYEYFHAGSSNTYGCMNVSGGNAPNPLISWGCGPGDNEKFTTTGVELRVWGKLCVTASGTSANSTLQINNCGVSNQKWDVWRPETNLSTSQIRLSGTSMCVTSPHDPASSALGDALTLQTCSKTNARQQFAYPGGGIINLINGKAGSDQVCWNTSGDDPTVLGSNSKVVLWNGCFTSGAAPNVQFNLSGKIKSLNNCITIDGPGDPFNAIKAAACDSSNTTTQIWEYYL